MGWLNGSRKWWVADNGFKTVDSADWNSDRGLWARHLAGKGYFSMDLRL